MTASLHFRVGLVALALTLSLFGCGDDGNNFPGPDTGPFYECVPEGFDAGSEPPAMDAGSADDASAPVEDAGVEEDAGGGEDAGVDLDSGPPRTMGCRSDQLCLNFRCHDRCTRDDDCSTAEMCVDGVCRASTGPRRDAGPRMDAGPPDPCDALTCDEPGLTECRPVSADMAACVACTEGAHCSAAVPVCNYSRGTCQAFVAAPCAPCNMPADCTGIGDCVELGDPVSERVCLPTCTMAGDCPQGLRCDLADGHCVPSISSCFNFESGVADRPCAMDSDCEPLGATAAAGTCGGMVCRIPCGTPEQCPAAFTCGGDGFCVRI